MRPLLEIKPRTGDVWPIEVRFKDHESLPRVHHNTLSLDERRLAAAGSAREYGEQLGRMLFTGPIADAFTHALARAQGTLHVALRIAARDLLHLRWEYLQGPIDGQYTFLAANQRTAYSQLIDSSVARELVPIHPRLIRALILVADPSGPKYFDLAPIDESAVNAAISRGLAGVPCTLLAGLSDAAGPPTLDKLVEMLTRERYDILHVVAHGRRRKDGTDVALFLRDAEGRTCPVPQAKLTSRLVALSAHIPALIVLTVCHSAEEPATGPSLARDLSERLGAAAIVAMNGLLSMPTADALATSFYTRLRAHGRVDTALAEATAGLSDRSDAFAPVLFTRQNWAEASLLERDLGAPDLVAMADRLMEDVPSGIRSALTRRSLTQSPADGRLHTLLASGKTPVLLATGPAGVGKSVWCARHAKARVRYQPVSWSPASALQLDGSDTVSRLALRAAFGIDDPARIPPLADYLRRESLRFFIVLDAIDEVQDFRAFLSAMRKFRTSLLAPHVDLLLTCREEALPDLEPHLAAWRSNLLDERDGALVRLTPLEWHHVQGFLRSEGATPEQAHRAASLVPPELAGLPLFLKQALSLIDQPSPPADTRNFLDRCSDLAIENIQHRLTQGGRAPSLRLIKRFIIGLARSAISSPHQAADMDTVETLMDPDQAQEGENTVRTRALHSGLLEVRKQQRVAFSHALYLEHFAALAAENAWPTEWPELASDEGKHIARRIARFMADPSWLVEAIYPIDPITACECAAQSKVLDSGLSTKLIEAIKITLQSRFRSDRLHALKVLGGLRKPEARRAAREWWNSMTATHEWHHYFLEAADLFLQLEDTAAIPLILHHRRFHQNTLWYDPSFLQRLRRIEPSFRERLIEHARSTLRDSAAKKRHMQAITALAMCGDTAFVEGLKRSVQGGVELSEPEIGALLHANTDSAMQVYRLALDLVLHRPLASYSGTDDDQRKNARSHRINRLCSRTADIKMYPHDAYIKLIADLLADVDREVYLFGMHAAEILASPALLAPYTAAKRRLGDTWWHGSPLIERILQSSSTEAMRGLFDAYDDTDIRSEIVLWAFRVPGPDTEDFLMDCIERKEHVFYAVQTLHNLRAIRAGPMLLALCESVADEHIRDKCVQALGGFRYRPAVPLLARLLSMVLDSPEESAVDSESTLIEALGQIGNDAAIDALGQAAPRTRYLDYLLSYLFWHREPRAHTLASTIAWAQGVDRNTVLAALDLQHAEFDYTIVPALKDKKLLELLLSAPLEVNATPRHGWDLMRSVARFDLPEATASLKQAASDPAHPGRRSAVDILASRGDMEAIKALVDEKVEQHAMPNPLLSPSDIDRMARWPKALVRDAILAHLRDDGTPHGLLILLGHMAIETDRALFQKIEAGQNQHTADIAHDMLRNWHSTDANRAKSPYRSPRW